MVAARDGRPLLTVDTQLNAGDYGELEATRDSGDSRTVDTSSSPLTPDVGVQWLGP
jgi:hypothetical protein